MCAWTCHKATATPSRRSWPRPRRRPDARALSQVGQQGHPRAVRLPLHRCRANRMGAQGARPGPRRRANPRAVQQLLPRQRPGQCPAAHRTAVQLRTIAATGCLECAVRFWYHAGFMALLATAGRMVLLDHSGGDAPPLTDRQTVLFRPDADITRALPVDHGPSRAARRCPPGPAGMLNVRRELLAQRGGVLGVQVDLIVGAVEREPDGLLGRAAGQVVVKDDAYFLDHLNLSTAIVP